MPVDTGAGVGKGANSVTMGVPGYSSQSEDKHKAWDVSRLFGLATFRRKKRKPLVNMDTTIDLLDPSKALDLDNIRFQLM